MIPAFYDFNGNGSHTVYEPVFLIPPSAPITSEIAFEGFGFARFHTWLLSTITKQQFNFLNHLKVISFPILTRFKSTRWESGFFYALCLAVYSSNSSMVNEARFRLFSRSFFERVSTLRYSGSAYSKGVDTLAASFSENDSFLRYKSDAFSSKTITFIATSMKNICSTLKLIARFCNDTISIAGLA